MLKLPEPLDHFRGKRKGKFHLITRHESPELELRYNPTLSLTSALDVGG
jgi:hypothetical protein